MSLVIARTNSELTHGRTDGWTHREADTGNDNTRRPKLASGKKLKYDIWKRHMLNIIHVWHENSFRINIVKTQLDKNPSLTLPKTLTLSPDDRFYYSTCRPWCLLVGIFFLIRIAFYEGTQIVFRNRVHTIEHVKVTYKLEDDQNTSSQKYHIWVTYVLMIYPLILKKMAY